MPKMKQLIKVSLLLSLFLVLIPVNIVFASTFADISNFKIDKELTAKDLQKYDYSKEYQEYLNKSDEEKKSVTAIPPMFSTSVKDNVVDTELTKINPFKVAAEYNTKVAAANMPVYSLRSKLPLSTKVENQGTLSLCWAFSGLGDLAAYLGYRNYQKTGSENQVFNFSEKHADYANIFNAFLNGQTNENGVQIDIGSGGSFERIESYLVNGTGAVSESLMPYDSKKEKIDISLINITPETTVYDTHKMDNELNSDSERLEKINQIKQAILDNGAVCAYIKGAVPFGEDPTTHEVTFSDNFNSSTGALYYPSSYNGTYDHQILITGWNDNYSLDNFNSTNRPQHPGAWEVKNSWGERIFISTMADALSQFPGYTEQQLMAELKASNPKFYAEDGKIYLEYGDKGYIWISYEDKFVNENNYQITNAEYAKTYDNVYQYNAPFVYNSAFNLNNTKVSYETVRYTKKSNKEEYLKRVGYSVLTPTIVKVGYATKADLTDLEYLPIKGSNEYTSLEPGFHALELTTPKKITTNEFYIVVNQFIPEEVDNNSVKILVLSDEYTEFSQLPYTKAGDNFVGYLDNDDHQIHYGDLNGVNSHLRLTLKAYTEYAKTPTQLSVTKKPKTQYRYGESFDPSGMIVKVTYSDGSSKEVTNYTIQNADNLHTGSNTITIKYTENGTTLTTSFVVTVAEEELVVSSISIQKNPLKTVYLVDESLDLTGGIIKVTYTNGTTKELQLTDSNVSVTGFSSTTVGNKQLTATYKGKTATFNIEVIEDSVDSISLTTKPKTEYVVGDTIDLSTGVITIHYESGRTTTLSTNSSEISVSGFNTTNPGSKEVTLTYKDFSVKYTINIKEKKLAETTDFSNSTATISDINMTPNTQSPRDYTLTFKLRIDNIKNVKEDERYTFRYYISTSDKLDKDSISFLTETSTIKKNSDGTYYTEITLNRNAIKELETQVTTNAYVYVEETASTSDDTKKEVHMVKISNLDISQLIINNQNGDPIDINNGSNNGTNNNGSIKDDTTAKGRLPQTGTKSILFAIGIIALISIISKAIYIKRNRELQGK